ncbi:MAG: trypsin-like peptidase domain-containing protein [Planctomycetota bacterium]
MRLNLSCCLLLLCFPLLWTPLSANPETTEIRSKRVADILAGKALPETVADLQAMEDHFQTLSERLRPTTVGLRIAGSQGSGVIINKDGLVLTAAHVIGRGAKGRRVTVILHDGRRVEGETLGADHDSDSALVQITTPGTWPTAEKGRSEDLKNGQWLLATGHPNGYEVGRSPPVRVGRVLRNWRGFVNSDCILISGDSGGPLFDMEGKVIGIHSRITASTAGNLHVQIDRFTSEWERLMAGEVWPAGRPYIGAYLDDRAENARIDEVLRATPAARAGLKSGDVVLLFGETKVADNDALRAEIRKRKAGDKVKLKVQRGDKTIELEITLGERGGRR